MKYTLTQMPNRTAQPRQNGITMVMDKGLSLREAEDLMQVGSAYIDFVKLGFGTALVTPRLAEKVKIYQQAGVQVFLGGTCFEAFMIRKGIDEYKKIIDQLSITAVEISDGSISIPHYEKCEQIAYFKEQGMTVLSEVGSKDAKKVMAPYRWLEQMKAELYAGSDFVIAEAREAGNIGLYRDSGEVREGLIEEILTGISEEKIIWEAPQKAQQVFFIKLLGCNVNLGNIAPQEIIALEATRRGLRGDTFELYLDI